MTMNNHRHRVSIGIPVYNGENFLEECLDYILSQTYDDFELLITDNASTDNTEAICRAYAAKDRRISYYRQEKNFGPVWNYNYAFEKSTGEYFKWAAHDDLCHPDFLLKCVEVLDLDKSIVLSYPQTAIIDDKGQVLRNYNYQVNTHSAEPQQRFRSLICVNHNLHGAFEIFGLIRSNILRMTPLIEYYARGDSILLARLSLYGRFYQIPESLFFKRYHLQRSVSAKEKHSQSPRRIIN